MINLVKIKQSLKNLVNLLGIDISRNFGFSPGIYNARYLSQLMQPGTVIDVGVGFGTHELYRAFPQAHFLLVEPLVEYRASIDRLTAEYSCEVIYKAVAKSSGPLVINVASDDPQLSSLQDRSTLTAKGLRTEKRLIDATTIDNIIEERELARPILLKVDTEGNELEVLKGAERTLSEIDCIIAEVSIAPRFENGYRFDDLTRYLADRNFDLFCFLYITHKADELQPRFADVLFIRRDPVATPAERIADDS